MDSLTSGAMVRAVERLASAMEAIRDLMARRNELLAQNVDGQTLSNKLHKDQLDLLKVMPLVYEDPLPKENF